MIFKKKEFFLLIFLILLQSCSGGRIGNFLEKSFNDLEKFSIDDAVFLLEEKLKEKKGSILKKTKVSNKKTNRKTKIRKKI